MRGAFVDDVSGDSESMDASLGNTFARVERIVRAAAERNLRNRKQCLAYLGSK